MLEQDIAITNITLDLIGQARNFYQYAAILIGNDCTEDKLAYKRDVREFKNLLLVEQPNGDWGQTILRQFFYSAYQYFLFSQWEKRHAELRLDDQLSAIAAKSLKEVSYHLRWSSEWVIRLGDGTEESHQRMLKAIDSLWPYTGEMFIPAEYEIEFVDLENIKSQWTERVHTIFTEATLPYPSDGWMHKGGKEGIHTEQLGYILSDLQFLQRAYPDAVW